MNPAEKKRLAYLDAMGIQVWTARFQGNAPAAPPTQESEFPTLASEKQSGSTALGAAPTSRHHAHVPVPPPSSEPDSRAAVDAETRGSRPSPVRMPGEALPLANQEAKGEQEPYESSEPESVGDAFFPEDDEFLDYLAQSAFPEPPVTVDEEVCDWDTLESRVAACTACPLHQSRTQTVFGVGDRDADWMIIGEAPGEQEDLKGEPFVGPAGLLLNEMLRAIGFNRDKVYIANILKCRPPRNRDPQPQEAEACEHHLRQQLALVKPRIILAVGRIAAQNLLRTATPIGKLRGQVHRYQHIPLVVTYHPAYLLRSPTEKRRAWEDLRLALKTYRQSQ